MSSTAALAGRPLTVDDANVNDLGAGHVEIWYGRMPGKLNTWNVAPAYSPIRDVEVAAVISRDATDQVTTTAAQIKWRITEAKPDGCNICMTLGLSHASQGIGNTPYLNGIVSCNHKGGALHLNAGVLHPEESGKTLTSWGVAYERDLGFATGHVEVFGQEQSKTTAQVGLRKDVLPGLQLDGTIGRNDRDTVFSLGVKKQF